MRQYSVNEVFYSLQGEGYRAGYPSVFLRFAGCNLQCRREVEGFDCDTDFSGGRKMTAEEVVAAVDRAAGAAKREGMVVILTGGEPTLQLDRPLCDALHAAGYAVAVETNGTNEIESGLVDFISCSPKTAEHTLRVGAGGSVDELRYVRHAGQALPKPALVADHHFISPAFEPDGTVKRETLEWCVNLCKENPTWRLSLQLHKLLGVR